MAHCAHPHRPPDADCGCGLWAFQADDLDYGREALFAEARRPAILLRRPAWLVVGEVELRGTTLERADGYLRAEHALPRRLWILRDGDGDMLDEAVARISEDGVVVVQVERGTTDSCLLLSDQHVDSLFDLLARGRSAMDAWRSTGKQCPELSDVDETCVLDEGTTMTWKRFDLGWEWRRAGALHRFDGPAVVRAWGDFASEYWINGAPVRTAAS